MPAFCSRAGWARALAAMLASIALVHGAAAPPAPPREVEGSALDATLFYQLLIGELELRSGEVGTAYQRLLEVARGAKSEQVFRRAVEVALQARAGDQALAAILAWRGTLP